MDAPARTIGELANLVRECITSDVDALGKRLAKQGCAPAVGMTAMASEYLIAGVRLAELAAGRQFAIDLLADRLAELQSKVVQ
jgi:hypothetical protein